MHKSPAILLSLLVLFNLVSCAAPASTSSTPVSQDTATTVANTLPVEPTASATTVPPTPTIPVNTPTVDSSTPIPVTPLGQVIQIKDLSLALLKIEQTQDQLQLTFASRNNGKTFQSLVFGDFTIANNGRPLIGNQCSYHDPNGGPINSLPLFAETIQPGGILRGIICWQRPSSLNGLKVIYAPANQPDVTAAWDLSSPGEAKPPAELVTHDLNTTLHVAGESVSLKDATITFNGVTTRSNPPYTNLIATANFELTNKGSSGVKFRDRLFADVLLKTVEGYNLVPAPEAENCQNNQRAVEMKAGQKLNIRLCYLTPGPILEPGALIVFYPSADHQAVINWAVR